MPNRWLVLAAGCLIQTILGGIYAWSTFVPYLAKDHGLSSAQSGFIFGLTILVFTSAMIVAGRVLVRKGPRFTALVSAVLFSSGYLLASVSGGSFPLLLLSLGCVAGCGIGFGYVCPLSVGIKWFPDRKGLVTGVAVSGFGAGAILLSSLAEYQLLQGVDVLTVFRQVGIFAGITLFTAALLLRDPPDAASALPAHGRLEQVFTWPFLVSVAGIFAGTFAGLLLIGNLAPLVMKAGLGEEEAAVAVSVFALGNGAGRIAWGRIFDHIHYRCIPISLIGFAFIAALLLLPLPGGLLMATVCLVGFGFGANFVIYAATISRFFGAGLFPRLYPVCFMAYGIAGVLGPGLGGWLADRTGSYDAAILICIVLVLAAGILSWMKAGVFQHDQTSETRSASRLRPSDARGRQ